MNKLRYTVYFDNIYYTFAHLLIIFLFILFLQFKIFLISILYFQGYKFIFNNIYLYIDILILFKFSIKYLFMAYKLYLNIFFIICYNKKN